MMKMTLKMKVYDKAKLRCLNVKSAEAEESNVQSCFPNLTKDHDFDHDDNDDDDDNFDDGDDNFDDGR